MSETFFIEQDIERLKKHGKASNTQIDSNSIVQGFGVLDNKVNFKNLKTYTKDKSRLCISERNLTLQTPKYTQSTFDNLVVRGKTIYRKTGDTNTNYKYHSDTVMDTMSMLSLGEEEFSGGVYPIGVVCTIDEVATTNTISLPEPLRAIYDVYDTVDFKGVYTKKIQKLTLVGTESIVLGTVGTSYVSFTVPLSVQGSRNTNQLANGRVQCDKISAMQNQFTLTGATTYGITMDTLGKNLIVNLPISAGTTVSALKTYLASNNITVLYPLGTPVITQLGTTYNIPIPTEVVIKVSLSNKIRSVCDLYMYTDTDYALDFISKSKLVGWNGALKVIDGELCNQYSTPIQLKGMSTFHLGKSTDKTTYNAIKTTKMYGANYLRIAMYLQDAHDGSKGYLNDPIVTKAKVKAILDWAISLDMYVCIDWHGLAGNGVASNSALAQAFFTEICGLYKNYPNVIYEIFNEPNTSTWIAEMVPYANTIIPLIRSFNSSAIILVGTMDWSNVVASPLAYSNILYSWHIYKENSFSSVGTYKNLATNFPMFISEWGVGDSGTETQESANYPSAMTLINEAKKHNISWAMWALRNDDSCHNFVKVNIAQDGAWIGYELSITGQFIVDKF